jgi:hypothetical protein
MVSEEKIFRNRPIRNTMVTVIFMKSVMEIALPVKKLSSKNWSNLSGV